MYLGTGNIRSAVLITAAVGWTFLSVNGQNARASENTSGIRLSDTARGEAAIEALGKRLPDVAAQHGKSSLELRKAFRADRSLHVDPTGQLFFACELECGDCADTITSGDEIVANSIGPTDPAPFDTDEAFLLHSRPGANRVIYLDFDGHIDNTPGNWKNGASAPAYNILNSNPGSFSTEERNRIIEIWQRVAEDFSMYEIDVTTEEPNIEDLKKTSSGDTRYGMRVVIGGSGNDWYGNGVGGVAFVGSFDAGNDVPCWVFPAGSGDSAKNIAEAASHEAGHTLGLFHDGVDGGAGYYGGQGNWGTIMGISYNKPISQWSKGEYTDANNTQDDLAVMLTQGAVYRPDDHGNSTAAATELGADSETASVAGVIERNTDLDFFRIQAIGGSLVIDVDPTPLGSNLRLEVKLYDAGGTELQTATSTDTSDGTQPVTLTRSVTAGSYYISVDGIGNGNPLTTGYSDYASLGQYNVVVSGVVPGGFTWQITSAGIKQWSSASNWGSGIVPDGAGSSVRVNNDIAGNQTIQLASPVTLGSLFLGDSNNTHAFTLASSGGSMIFDNPGSSSSLSKTTGGNDVISAPVSLVGELVLTQSASGTLGFSGGISGSGSLNKTGAGTVVFGTANTYTGPTTLTDGLLRLDDADGLPGGIDNTVGAGESAMSFKGGVLGLASGDFTRQTGTGAGQLNWSNGSGGFAAFGDDRQVRLNNGTSAFSWQTAIIGPNNILVLGHPTATHTLDFRNGISFAGSKRTVQVEDGEAAVDAILSGVLFGGNSSGFTKTGPGILSLSNSNTYTGATTVAGGVLRLQNTGALPSGNLELSGGILGLGAGDLVDRTIGTEVDQLRWTGEGGFAAFGADRAVKFSNDSINWADANFIGGSRSLILGHESADATLDWQQKISLAGSTRTIQTHDGSAMIDVKMSGVVAGGSSGTNNVFNKTGAGTLAFTAQNTYWGDTIVSLGTLMIGDGGTSGGVSRNSLNIFVDSGATLAVNRSDTVTQGTAPLMPPISGNGDFAQVGSGTTVLTLANSYTGDTSVDAGTLQLGADDAIPNGSDSGDLLLVGTLDLNGFSDTINGLNGSGNVDNTADSTSSTLTVGDTDFSGTFNGTLQNSGTSAILNLAKIGSGTLTLTGTNTYSGTTIVSGGTLEISSLSGLGNTSGITLGGGTTFLPTLDGVTVSAPITLGATGTTATIRAPSSGVSGELQTLTLNGPISGDGNVRLFASAGSNTQGTIVLGAQSTFAGNITLDTAGPGSNGQALFVKLGIADALPATTVLTIDGGEANGSFRYCQFDMNGFDLTLAGLASVDFTAGDASERRQWVSNTSATGATLTIDSDSNSSFGSATDVISDGSDAQIRDNINLVKDGTGIFSLGAIGASYTRDTTVNAGILRLYGANPSNQSSTVTIADSGATLDLAFSGTDTVDKLFIGTTQMAAGEYKAVGSAASGTELAQLTGTGTLTVTTGPAGFASWATTNGAAGGFDDDHDNDGVTNGVEFFIGGPTGNTTGQTTLPAVDDDASTLSITWTKAADYPGVYGTDYWVETSATLTAPWTVQDAEPDSGFTVTFPSTTEVKFTFPAGTKDFARLSVTGP